MLSRIWAIRAGLLTIIVVDLAAVVSADGPGFAKALMAVGTIGMGLALLHTFLDPEVWVPYAGRHRG